MHAVADWLGGLTTQDLADLIRTVCVPLAVISGAISLRVAVNQEYRTYSQLCRFLGLATLCFGVALGQYHNIGRPPYWPVLLLLLAGEALSLIGTIPLALRRDDSVVTRDDKA